MLTVFGKSYWSWKNVVTTEKLVTFHRFFFTDKEAGCSERTVLVKKVLQTIVINWGP